MLIFVYILALPYLLFLTSKSKYRHSIPARFFLFNNPPFIKNGIWLHGCSLGEIRSLKPLVDKISLHINLTTTTQTGFNEAQKMANDSRYLPFEIWLPFWIKQPKALVVTEAELWALLFIVPKLKGVKTFLINARMSDNSYKNYKRFAPFYKFLFSYIDTIFAQTQTDKQRLQKLGAKKVVVNGNIKTAFTPQITKVFHKPKRRVITIASSHEGEEELLLKALPKNKENMLIIAPRHPERFDKVNTLLRQYAKQYNLTYKRFSNQGFNECDILLCDTLGELINIYAITTITILGGSFIDGIGGHNPLEPAFFKNTIISGKYIFNQKALYARVKNIYFSDASNLSGLLKQKLQETSLHTQDSLKPILDELEKI